MVPRKTSSIAPGTTGAAISRLPIRVTATGGKELLWYEQVAIYCKQSQQSYYAYAETERHFGLGARADVDVSVEFYPSGKVVKRAGVKANTTLRISETD